MSTDAGKMLMTMRIVNGQVQLDLPDDPTIGEGPTHFELHLVDGQVAALGKALPDEARERIRRLMNAHADDLNRIWMQREAESEEIRSRQRQATRQRAALETGGVS